MLIQASSEQFKTISNIFRKPQIVNTQIHTAVGFYY